MKPVAWIDYLEDSNLYDLNVSGRGIPLYFEPKQQVVRAPTYRTLTDEEIIKLKDEYTKVPSKPWSGVPMAHFDVCGFARAILKKASEK